MKSFRTRKYAPRIFSGLVDWFIMTAVASLVVVRLGNMNLSGVAATSAAFIAVTVALTSLLYNRARAHSAGPLQRRTLFAAEMALRSVLLILVGVVAFGIAVLWLNDYGFRESAMSGFPPNAAPFWVSLPVALIMAVGVLHLVSAVQIGVPSFWRRMRVWEIRGYGKAK